MKKKIYFRKCSMILEELNINIQYVQSYHIRLLNRHISYLIFKLYNNSFLMKKKSYFRKSSMKLEQSVNAFSKSLLNMRISWINLWYKRPLTKHLHIAYSFSGSKRRNFSSFKIVTLKRIPYFWVVRTNISNFQGSDDFL